MAQLKKGTTIDGRDVLAELDAVGSAAWDTWLQMPGYYVTTSFGSTTITETIKNSTTQSTYATKVTTFNANGSITEKVTPASGPAVQTVTVFNSDGSITQTITNV